MRFEAIMRTNSNDRELLTVKLHKRPEGKSQEDSLCGAPSHCVAISHFHCKTNLNNNFLYVYHILSLKSKSNLLQSFFSTN